MQERWKGRQEWGMFLIWPVCQLLLSGISCSCRSSSSGRPESDKVEETQAPRQLLGSLVRRPYHVRPAQASQRGRSAGTNSHNNNTRKHAWVWYCVRRSGAAVERLRMYIHTPHSIKLHRPRPPHRSASHHGWTPEDRREDGGRGKRRAESERTRLAWASSIRQRGRALHGECEGDIR